MSAAVVVADVFDDCVVAVVVCVRCLKKRIILREVREEGEEGEGGEGGNSGGTNRGEKHTRFAKRTKMRQRA